MRRVGKINFFVGQFYCINQDPDTLFAYGAAEHAGEMVQLLRFEDLHGYDHKPGARVRFADGSEHWLALEDLQGDNILWDTYSAFPQSLPGAWLAHRWSQFRASTRST